MRARFSQSPMRSLQSRLPVVRMTAIQTAVAEMGGVWPVEPEMTSFEKIVVMVAAAC
jgi:hypothetical protein